MLLVQILALPGLTVSLASHIPGRHTGHLEFSVEGHQTLAGQKWNSYWGPPSLLDCRPALP